MSVCCGGDPVDKPCVPQTQTIPALLHLAPCWSSSAIVDSKIQVLSLDDFKGKYLVLLFYPYDFTFVCPTELIQFNDRVEEFRNLDAEVVALSTDSEYVHFAWITTPRKQGGLGEMRIPVVSDKSHRISKLYGVLDEENGIAMRGLFVIDKNQKIRHVTLNEIAIPRSVDEVLRLIQVCQFVDKYGDTCPMGPRYRIDVPQSDQLYFDTT